MIMNKIIAARFITDKSFEKMGRSGQPLLTLKRVITDANSIEAECSFYVVGETTKGIVPTTKLVGETFQIGGTIFYVKVVEAGKFDIFEQKNESLPSKNSVKQLKAVAKASKRVSKAGKHKQKDLLSNNIEAETRTIYDWYQFNENYK